MTSTDTGKNQIDERRGFLHDLQDRDDILNTDFSRDGLQDIYIEFGDGGGFHKSLQEQAQSHGYQIEHLRGGVYLLSQR